MTKLLLRLFIKEYENVKDDNIRQKCGILAGCIGIICNIMLFLAKFIAGILTSSIAITADSFNNLSDAGSSVVTLIGFKLSSMPADKEHPFGHGRIEYISGLIVSMLIIFVGFQLAITSIEKIITVTDIYFDVISLLILIVSVLVKIWLWIFNKNVGKMIDSTAMKATAMDNISDVIATSAVVVSILVYKFTGLNVDGYIGVLVALFICYTGVQTAKETLNPLLGNAPKKEFVQEIEQVVLSYPYIIGIHDLIVHNYGHHKTIISLHAEVSSKIDIIKIHDIVDTIEQDLNNRFDCETVIHMDPIIVDDKVVVQTLNRVKGIVKSIDSQFSIHDFRMVKGDTHTNLIFDIVVPYNHNMSDRQIIEEIENKIRQLDSKYKMTIRIDKSLV